MSLGKVDAREDGATAITLMIVLTVLLGFAAIAVDGAAAWALKRQDQSAADTGAVAGAIFTANRTKAVAMADAETEIIRITFATVSPDMTLAEWTTEWALPNCTDSNKPARFVETLNSDCISFTSNLSEVRVQTPIIPSAASFGGIFGVTQLDTSAAAEVTTNLISRGGVLPFGLPGNAAGDTEICLKTGANPQNVSPCDGPATGNFSFLDFTEFGNADLGTTTTCQGNGTAPLVRNIAHGVDHPLSTTDIFPVATSNTDRDACLDGNFNARPYQVATNPGNVAQALDDGLADGIGGVDGRLTQGGNRIDVRGNLLDNTPLWDLLNSAGVTQCGSPANHDDMIACLAGYDPNSDGVIFQTAVGGVPRFGWVPLFWEPTLGGGSTLLTIKTFIPVYIQTTFWKCNALGCDLEWDPGEPNPDIIGPNNIRIEASTAIIIPLEALPEEVRVSQPGTDGQIQYLISK